MLIKVSQEHIDNGRECNNLKCPVALALLDLGFVPSVNGLEVNFFKLRVWDDCKFLGSADLPENAIYSIDAFDSGIQIQPFEFELNIPEVILKERRNDDSRNS
jgi:hypothetical protein